MDKIVSQDRSSLIKLASGLPKGSEERRAILAGLKKARMDVNTLVRLIDYGIKYGTGPLDIEHLNKTVGADVSGLKGITQQKNVLTTGFTARGADLVKRAKRGGMASILPILEKLASSL